MAVRTIFTIGDEVLRKHAKPVETIDKRIKTLLDDMAQTMYHTGNAVGLAANQIGVLQRLIVLDTGGGLKQFVNPEIVEASGRQICVEGCLSFPGRWARTVRPQRVRVRFLDKQGDSREMVGQGELAKCLCHEIDHLNGLLLPDRAVGWL